MAKQIKHFFINYYYFSIYNCCADLEYHNNRKRTYRFLNHYKFIISISVSITKVLYILNDTQKLFPGKNEYTGLRQVSLKGISQICP